MVQNQPQSSLEELAVRAKKAALQAKDDSLSSAQRQQASLDKQLALTQLMPILIKEITIKLPKPSNMNSSEYIYEEAVQDVSLYVCKNIHKYDPDKGSVLAWFVFYLKKTKIRVFHWLNWNGKVTSLYIDDDDCSIDLINYYVVSEGKESVSSESLIEFIKEDPEGLLSNRLFKNNPQASFQAILLKRCEEDKSWEEIVQELELGATHGPIYTFYRRNCEKFTPYFKKYLCE